MQNMTVKIGLIVVVLGLCLLSIFNQELRLGKDLRGGVSLVYKVTIPEDTGDPQRILAQVISVLKERVNPTGVLDISMQPLGRDRIEIVMPLPNEEVRALARTYQDALTDLLRQSEIRESDLDEALRNGTAPASIGGDPTMARGATVAALQLAYDEQNTARTALADAEARGAEADELRPLQFAVASAENRFETLYGEVLGLSLGEARVRRILALPTDEPMMADPTADATAAVDDAAAAEVAADTGDDAAEQAIPSQRDEGLRKLTSDFPHLTAAIQAAVDAYDTYQDERTGFDDPEDLVRLLRGAGVLEFHIAITNSEPGGADINEMRSQLQEIGPENASSPVARWYPINEVEQWASRKEQLEQLRANPVAFFENFGDLVADVYEGQHFILLFKTAPKSMTHNQDREWAITQTFASQDGFGRPAISFNLDASGSGLMGRLTGQHIGKPMAIILDDQVYSAPTIQGQISANGQITGNFSQKEIDYLLRVLAAGSLQAQLSPDPIAVNTLGPSIGADNLQRGKMAFIIALIAVAVFMVSYYFLAGIVAVLGLVANGVIIFGVMMGIDGTFTLPGLAGIVLTVGMAVDANVLIYERIREEIFGGEHDLRGAIRQGYRKALSTILDANITNLIVCFVLFKTATTEVKGFALTLTIGICATLFTALFVTRQFYYFYTDILKVKKLSMLPTVVPAIHRALEPSIDWIGLRKIFWTISFVAVVSSIAMVGFRGVDMFDTEFRGGVSMTMLTMVVDENGDGEPDQVVDGEPVRHLLRHTGDLETAVEDRIQRIGEKAAADLATATDEGERQRLTILKELEGAAILTAGETSTDANGNVVAQRFQIKVSSPKGLDDDKTITEAVVAAIVGEFGDKLDVTQPLDYRGASDPDSGNYVFPISKDELGANIKRSDATQRVRDFLGGAAIVLSDVEPPVTPEELEKRIDRMRNQPDFVRYSGRSVKAIGLTLADPGDRRKGYSELVVLVNDPFRSFLRVDNAVWYDEVAEPEWKLIAEALQVPTSLEQVSSYSSAVAETLSAQAIVAVVLSLLGILVYIWVRFGSLRYSVAAIAALVHDVTIALGLLALSTYVGGPVFHGFLLIEPFRIDLGVVAALLTIIGYSLNDTIVILDRIRENRGKLPLPTAAIVNQSINQTVSRTLLTSVTTLIAVGIMYAEGGSGIRPFTFCLLVGLVVGTYSSVAIAAPLVYTRSPGRRPGAAGKAIVDVAPDGGPELSATS